MNIAFIGSKELGIRCLKSLIDNGLKVKLIISTDDIKDARSALHTFKTVKTDHKLKFCLDPNEVQLEKLIRSNSIDLIFVCNWYKLIPTKILELPKIGTYGLHNSLLPKYRGMSPLIWSSLSDDKFIGSSLFKFDKGMDTGAIAKQWKIKNEGLYIEQIIDKLSSKIVKDLPSIVKDLQENKIQHIIQDNSKATYCNKRISSDSRLKWAEITSKEALRQIQIFNTPYPFNFCYFQDKKISILKAEIFNYPIKGIAGSLFHLNGEVIVCCIDGKGISIKEVIDENGKQIKVASLKGRLT